MKNSLEKILYSTLDTYLSIIIPAYDDQNRLPKLLVIIDGFLRTKTLPAEVIIIENGSTDNQPGIVKREQFKDPYIRLISEKHRGKVLL